MRLTRSDHDTGACRDCCYGACGAKERQQVSAPSAAARSVVLHLTMMTITRAPAPVAGGFSRLGFRAALSHHHHRMVGCRRPRQQASHQAFSHLQLPMLIAVWLASAQSTAHCGFVSTTLLLAIARTTGIGRMLGASSRPLPSRHDTLMAHLYPDQEASADHSQPSPLRSSAIALRPDQRELTSDRQASDPLLESWPCKRI